MAQANEQAYKYCFVPGCQSTTRKYPEKIFFRVPERNPERSKWIKMTRRDTISSPLSPKSRLYCCEDHFDVESDMDNFLQYKSYCALGFATHAKLKPGVLPHKFECQTVRLLTLHKPRYSVVEKLQRAATVKEAFIAYDCEEKGQALPSTSEAVPSTSEAVPSTSETTPSTSEATPSDHQDFQVPQSTEITEEPLLQVQMTSSKQNRKVKSTQTSRRLLYPQKYSKGCQTEGINKRPLMDSTTQVTPTKKLLLSIPTSPEPSSSSETATISVGGSVYTVSSSCTSESLTESFEDGRISAMRKHLREATIFNIEKNPKFYIGIPPESYNFLTTVAELTHFTMRDILLTLKKLKLNQPFIALGDDFGISQSRASRIFSTVIYSLAAEMKALVYSPTRESIAINMPIPFRRRYSKVVAIIDCFEVKIEKPSNPLDQALTWSEYKKSNTIKFLVASTPNGFITYISKGYCGRTTDSNLTEDCGFNDTIAEGGHIMADRGFKHLDKVLTLRNIKLVRPPSVRSGEKLTLDQAKETKRIASLRINIERVIGRIRVFQILAPGTVLDLKLAQTVNAAAIVACALCNFHDPLFS